MINLDRPVRFYDLPINRRLEVVECGGCFKEDNRWVLCAHHRDVIRDDDPEKYR